MTNKSKKKGKDLERSIVNRSMEYIMAAFGLVAGLAWNEAIKSLINYLFPITSNSIIAKFVYAAIMTIVVVILSKYLVRVFKENPSRK